MVFFILFLWNMLCGVWANQAGDPVVAQQNRQKMHVVIKMFFVMGVSWIAEIILFFINWLVGGDKIYKGIFLFQLINSLQVHICLLVVHELVVILFSPLKFKGGGMHLIFPVIVTVIVLLQCLSCSFKQD